MTVFDRPHITPLGATAMLVRFGDRIDPDLALRITRLVDHLDRLAPPGIIDLVPSYTTLLVLFDPERTSHAQLSTLIAGVSREGADSPEREDQPGRSIDIPVVYGGEAGPDLEDVARHTGLSADDVIRRHSEVAYTVGAVGFSPGFAFLIGLPPELEMPRRASPRTRVPAGSVGIAGAQTGIYSLPTPGGWSLIGRTPRVMFDPAWSSDAELRPGDQVRFIPIKADDAPRFQEPGLGDGETAGGEGALEVLEPGVQTTVQDLGRPGQGRAGITPGGAVDRSALVAGNRLLGNPDGAAALEWTLIPPAIRFHSPCRIALTGADPGWRLDDRPVRIGEVAEVTKGQTLRAQVSGRMVGARGYICVPGGIDVPVVRGSRALDLSAGFGGGFGRPLGRGDLLRAGGGQDNPNTDHPVGHGLVSDPSRRPFRVVRGPQADRFGDRAWRTFQAERYTVDAQSNRMGLRLNGPAMAPEGGADIISEGVVTGAIQVTGGGQPIVLLPGRATIGGYTKIATVIEADHDRLGQLRPGDTIRFEVVSLEDAEQALREWRPSIHGGLHSDEEQGMSDDRDSGLAAMPGTGGWTPDGVIRVIRALADHDVSAFSLRVESAGLEIAIDRGGGLPGRPGRVYEHRSASSEAEAADAEQADDPVSGAGNVVTAPLLGTFWRRPAPEQPMFIDVGDTIEAGQVVGLIEVMKSFHEVSAPMAGVVTRVLVEDGDSVEYGEALVEIDPLSEG